MESIPQGWTEHWDGQSTAQLLPPLCQAPDAQTYLLGLGTPLGLPQPLSSLTWTRFWPQGYPVLLRVAQCLSWVQVCRESSSMPATLATSIPWHHSAFLLFYLKLGVSWSLHCCLAVINCRDTPSTHTSDGHDSHPESSMSGKGCEQPSAPSQNQEQLQRAEDTHLPAHRLFSLRLCCCRNH